MSETDYQNKRSFRIVWFLAATLIVGVYLRTARFVWKWIGERRAVDVEYTLPSGAVAVEHFVTTELPPWMEAHYAPIGFLREAPLCGPVLNGYFDFVEGL